MIEEEKYEEESKKNVSIKIIEEAEETDNRMKCLIANDDALQL